MTDPAVTPEQTAADLRAGADAIREYGWTRGVFWDPKTGCLCFVGGITVGVCGRVPTVPGVAGKPTWKPSQVLLPDETARVKVAEATVTRYIRRHNLLDGDVAEDPEDIDTDHRKYDAVDWNDHECGGADDAIRLLETIADELTAVTT